MEKELQCAHLTLHFQSDCRVRIEFYAASKVKVL